MHFARMEADLAALRKELQLTQQDAKAIAVVRDQVVAIEPWAGERTRWLDVLIAINDAVDNKQAYLTGWKVNDVRRSVTLSGKAVAIADATRLRDRLAELPAFTAELQAKNLGSAARDPFPLTFTIELAIKDHAALTQWVAAQLGPDRGGQR
jgi:hypothetical protein